uniref:Uncharacterized protein n=1 Tax=Anopheles dirus TaxID=7168 RepID=A0A182NWL1_9DIPT
MEMMAALKQQPPQQHRNISLEVKRICCSN